MKLDFTITGSASGERPLQEIRGALYALMARLESLAWEHRNKDLEKQLEFSILAEKAWMDVTLERSNDGN